MEQHVAIMLTAVITVTTIIYTFYSIQLWRTSQKAADISRQAALASLWSELNNYIEVCKQENRPEANFLQQLSGVFAEYMIANLMHNASSKTDPHLTAFKQKVEEIITKENVNITNNLRWLMPFLNK